MLLDRWLKPKWRHPDPEIRRRSLQSLASDDPLLVQLAKDDEDPATRKEALARSGDLSLLLYAAQHDGNAEVRAYAETRSGELLAGRDPGAPSLEQRLERLAELPTALLERIASHGAEAQLRLCALQRLNDQARYAEAALKDPALEIRTVALDKVQEPGLLERVARDSRNRDKRISRAARERLKSWQMTQQRKTQLSELCAVMETLTWDGEAGPNAVRFGKLTDAWRSLAAYADDAQRQRFRQARERFQNHFRASAAQRAARLKLCETLQAHHDRSIAESDCVPERLTEQLRQARLEWDELGEALEPHAKRLEQRFAQLEQAIRNRSLALQRDRQRAAQLEASIADAERLLQRPGEISAKQIDELEMRWQRLPMPDQPQLREAHQRSFAQLVQQLQQRLARQAERKEQELRDLQTQIDALEQALEKGELSQAMALYEQARKGLAGNVGLSRRQAERFDERLQTSHATIARLRGWRRWGDNRAREKLCEQAESLPDASLEPVEQARQVKALRAAWKDLDRHEGAAPKALWKRFNSACERAYAPAQAHFAAQAEQRRHNLEQRRRLCQEIEDFVARQDWDGEIDWRAVDCAAREVQKQWRQLGAVDRAQRKAIDDRYRAALESLQIRLQPQREQDLARRLRLVERVENAQNDELRAATDAAIQAQREWQPRLLGSRRQEQALWKRFRAACDAVFEKRDAARRVQDDQRRATLAQRATLCAELESLLGDCDPGLESPLDDAQLDTLRHRYRELRRLWQELGAAPRNGANASEQRFEKSCAAIEQRLQQQQQRKVRAQLDVLRARAALCAALEAQLEDGGAGGDTDASERDWRQQAPLPDALEAPLKRRFERVCAALSGDALDRRKLIQQLEANHDAKQRLCLRLEILSGTETPEEFTQARMEYQVERLSASLSEGINRAETAEALEREWYALGVLPASEAQALEARFGRALQALHVLVGR